MPKPNYIELLRVIVTLYVNGLFHEFEQKHKPYLFVIKIKFLKRIDS